MDAYDLEKGARLARETMTVADGRVQQTILQLLALLLRHEADKAVELRAALMPAGERSDG